MDSPTQPDMESSTIAPVVPAWVAKELPHMAECEGCIAEQRIEHTCGNHDLDSVISKREHMGLTPAAEEEEEEGAKSKHISLNNTWPRKRIRNTPNIATFFTEDVSGSRLSIDDNDYSYACNRVLRGEGGMHLENLPPELETVKKGTPLYGQPDWWGDDDANAAGDAKDLKDPSVRKEEEEVSSVQDSKSEEAKSTTPPKDLSSMTTSVSKDSLLSQQTSAATGTPESPDQKVPESAVQESATPQLKSKLP
ncbi:hypothetical protein FSP39_010696 [Pinctada imbricata]|uniref:Uncharacterized protein n=1 Tax=Pinctada imbricata TaxID=66713 RepID=A0AA89BSW9_PINIB|nr:hypothetical protein FSP39_010696 [Pinctada imbricata]